MKTFKKHTMKTLSMLVIAGGVLFGGMTGNVQAGDKKVYSATMCKAKRGNNGTLYLAIRYETGRISNLNERRRSILCPVIRDNTSNANGLKAWGIVGKNANNEGQEFKCKMSSKDSVTGRTIDSGGDLTLAYGKAFRTFKDSRKTPHKSRRSMKSTYNLICYIPGKVPGKEPSYLVSYWVEEY